MGSEGHEMGVNFTLNHLRECYMVVNSRELVKRTIKTCTECKRWCRGKPSSQQIALLPKIHLELTMKRFTNCSVDFAILGNAEDNDEELETMIIGIESLIKSRPLTPVSGDPNDDPVLTPNHFFIGKMGRDVAPEGVDYTQFNPKK